MLRDGFPRTLRRPHWLGHPADKIRQLCREGLAEGWRLKIKVGASLEDDVRRLRIVREEIGPDRFLMVDANQRWDVPQAIEWMKHLAPFEPLWIEEPTSPDDILGHAAISRSGRGTIGVATGEHCQNRVIFSQLPQADAIRFCQIDACCRLGGVNEVLAVLLLAAKFGVPVCPHAGGGALAARPAPRHPDRLPATGASLENRVLEQCGPSPRTLPGPVHHPKRAVPGAGSGRLSIELKLTACRVRLFRRGRSGGVSVPERRYYVNFTLATSGLGMTPSPKFAVSITLRISTSASPGS
ncbi:MAG: enolase C-terminal domain-like protein [Gemmatimonadales bacterium]